MKIKKTIFILFLTPLFLLIPKTSFAIRSNPLIIDHTSIQEFDQIPTYWLNQAKTTLKIAYGHTSHGSQIITGMNMLGSSYAYFDDYYYYKFGSNNPKAPDGTLSLWDQKIEGASDLGNPDRTAWKSATENMLDSSQYGNRNTVIWSWCGQADTTNTNIDLYLSQMNELENKYTNTTFVYMTGHLNGTGTSGNLNQRNQQIRNYVKQNNKILFDFADIESYDPNNTFYPNASDGCEWCSNWCSSHSCPSCTSCAHSHCFNCYNKGKAFWVMLAKIAGWNDNETNPTTVPIPINQCPADKPPRSTGNADCNDHINISDFAIWKKEFIEYKKQSIPINNYQSDFNNDQKINISDFAIWKINFLQSKN